MFFHEFTLCSAHVSALVTVLNESPCERIGKWGGLLYIEKGCLKNHRTTAAQVTAELNIHLKDPVSKNTVQH
jgi:hypothetical protein